MITKSQLEAWVHKVLDLVEAKKKIEDDRVELKREFLANASKAARRIAAHANDSRGDLCLLIIGADEKEGIIGANDVEFSSWWPQIASQFNGIAPDIIHHLSIPRGDSKHVVAVLLDSTRAPYVIQNPDFGTSKTPIEFEVPFRQGVHTRSARREDMLKILAPLAALPECEVISCSAGQGSDPRGPLVSVSIQLYLTAQPGQEAIVRRHKCAVYVSVAGEDTRLQFHVESLGVPSGFRETSSIVGTKNELTIRGAGMVYLVAQIRASAGDMAKQTLNVVASLDIAFANKTLDLQMSLKPSHKNESGLPSWIYVP
jgi:hypothetical protein